MDDTDDLPSEFDVIVIGTGMVESIVAASASRIGKSVLHLDRNIYYGDSWATVNLEGLLDYASYQVNAREIEGIQKCAEDEIGEDGTKLFNFSTGPIVTCLAYKWFIPSSLLAETIEEVDNKNTDCRIDLCDADDVKTTVDTTDSNESNIGRNDDLLNTIVPESEGDLLESLADSKSNLCEETLKPLKDPKVWCQHDLLHLSRKFNIDLAPKVIYAKGATVELLLQSCVHRYAEFQSVNKILSYLPKTDTLEEVPCTKSQVFSCRTFSIVDKRILMKVLNTCINFDATNAADYTELKDKTFVDVMKSKNTPEHLVTYILESVAMGTNVTSMEEACSRIKSFFNNVGRYGHSPFLWPLYGSGELLQAFCRLSAVYGGVYYLGRGAEGVSVTTKDNTCSGIISNGRRIKANHIVTSAYCCPSAFKKESVSETSSGSFYLSRTILFTDRPLQEENADGKESISLLHISSQDGSSTVPVQVLELPSITGSCPKELFVVQITCEQKEPNWNPIKSVLDRLFTVNKCEVEVDGTQDSVSHRLIRDLSDGDLKNWFIQNQSGDTDMKMQTSKRPQILFAFHYDLIDSASIKLSDTKPSNLHLCHGPDVGIDLERAVSQAKEIFGQMFPDQEFLEPTPDPNEITLSDLLIEENEGSDQQSQENVKSDDLIDKPVRDGENKEYRSSAEVEIQESVL